MDFLETVRLLTVAFMGASLLYVFGSGIKQQILKQQDVKAVNNQANHDLYEAYHEMERTFGK